MNTAATSEVGTPMSTRVIAQEKTSKRPADEWEMDRNP
jgi:hypothetical protein